MKQVITAVAIALIVVAAFRLLNKSAIPSSPVMPQPIAPSKAPLTPYQPANTLDYQFSGKVYRVSWFTIDNPQKLTLVLNYSEKRPAQEIKISQHCQNLTNAGFYAKDGAPIGLVIADRVTLHAYESNALFNGVFSVTSEEIPHISTQVVGTPRLAVQTGPVLMSHGQIMQLAIRSDEPSRRVVVGITDADKPIFLAFYNPDSPYQGPLLGQLPQHVKEFQTKSGIIVTDALNLDGGSASAFASHGLFLEELTTVGSFFCVR